MMFKENIGVHKEWIFPPAYSMQDVSYNHCMFWYK